MLPVEPDDDDMADEWAYGDENGNVSGHGHKESDMDQFGVEMSNLSNSSSSSAASAAGSSPRVALSDQRVTRRREQSDSAGEEYEEQVTV